MGDTPNKYSYGGKNIHQDRPSIRLLYVANVVSNADKSDGSRVQVRIKGLDDQIADADLAFCFPMIPKFLGSVPNVGESVMVIMFNSESLYEKRMYFGPIISQPQKLKNDPFLYSSTSLMDGGFTEPEQAPSELPNAKGIYPDKANISIQGRDNSDIIFKPREVLIRAGKHLTDNNLVFNKVNPAFIQLKHDVVLSVSDDGKTEERGSVNNIVASKINLLTHSGGNPRFVLNDQESMISDEELQTIIADAHSLAYGDRVQNFIRLMQEFVSSHVHAYHGIPPDITKNVNDILNFDVDAVVSKNIKIN